MSKSESIELPKAYRSRGTKNRERILNDFIVEPTLKVINFIGNTEKTYFGGEINTDYYIFSFKERHGEKHGFFLAGAHCAIAVPSEGKNSKGFIPLLRERCKFDGDIPVINLGDPRMLKKQLRGNESQNNSNSKPFNKYYKEKLKLAAAIYLSTLIYDNVSINSKIGNILKELAATFKENAPLKRYYVVRLNNYLFAVDKHENFTEKMKRAINSGKDFCEIDMSEFIEIYKRKDSKVPCIF